MEAPFECPVHILGSAWRLHQREGPPQGPPRARRASTAAAVPHPHRRPRRHLRPRAPLRQVGCQSTQGAVRTASRSVATIRQDREHRNRGRGSGGRSGRWIPRQSSLLRQCGGAVESGETFQSRRKWTLRAWSTSMELERQVQKIRQYRRCRKLRQV